MSRITSGKTRDEVKRRAQYRCEYCLLPDNVENYDSQVDHILAPDQGGSDDLDNLALACFYCNNHKGRDFSTYDFETGEQVNLYNPRSQKWDEHFELQTTGEIHGKTPQGRATQRLLNMNHPKRIELRATLLGKGLW